MICMFLTNDMYVFNHLNENIVSYPLNPFIPPPSLIPYPYSLSYPPFTPVVSYILAPCIFTTIH